MSDTHRPVQTNALEMATGATGAWIGRGTGLTLKEFGRRLNGLLRRRGEKSRQWRTLKQKQAAARRVRRAMNLDELHKL